MRRMCRFIIVLIIGLCGVLRIGAAELPEDAAIVVSVSGVVMYHNTTTTPTPVAVQAFMKLCQADVLTLAEESQVKLIYLDGGRQETWQGPVVLTLGKSESQAQTTGTAGMQPQVETLSNQISTIIVESVLPFSEKSIERVAATSQRGNEQGPLGSGAPLELTEQELAEVEAAKEMYAQLKQQRGADDMTPELYLLSVLAEYELYDDIRTKVAELLQTDPDNPVLQIWAAWVQEK